MYDKDFIMRSLKSIKSENFGLKLATEKRIVGMLNGMLEEFEFPSCIPLGFSPKSLSRHIKSPPISKKELQ